MPFPFFWLQLTGQSLSFLRALGRTCRDSRANLWVNVNLHQRESEAESCHQGRGATFEIPIIEVKLEKAQRI